MRAPGASEGERESGVERARSCPGAWLRFLEAPPFEVGVIASGELPAGLVFFGALAEAPAGGASSSVRLRAVSEVGTIVLVGDESPDSGVFTGKTDGAAARSTHGNVVS